MTLNKRVKSISSILSSVLLTLFGLMVITFMIGRVMPVDPVIAAVGDNAPEDVIVRVRAEMGLDQPLVVQFFHYVTQVLHGDFGNSILTRNPVWIDIKRVFPATFELATAALILAALIGIPLGVWAAVKQGKLTDQVIRVVCLAGHSVPVFMLALISLLVFYATLGVAPGPGRQDIIYDGMITQVTGLMTVDTLLAGDWDAFTTPSPIWCSPSASSPISAWPISPA